MNHIKFSGDNVTWFLSKPWRWTDPNGYVWHDRGAEENGEGGNASGLLISVPGIALASHSTLSGWWMVTLPDGRRVVTQQIDIGPGGEDIDLSAPLAYILYGSPDKVDAGNWSATYLGKTLPLGIVPGVQKET
jgi:hypothetical protein